MDYIIEIQNFKDKDGKFLPKEVAVLSLQGDIVQHWIIAPPHGFEELSRDLQICADFHATRVYGLNWFEGDISLRKLRHHFYNIARRAKRIYVKGFEKARFVRSIMGRTVENIEAYTSTGYEDLQKRFDCKQLCLVHGCLLDEHIKTLCALRKAFLLREWLYSLAGENPRAQSSDFFYRVLQKCYWERTERSMSTTTTTSKSWRHGVDVVDGSPTDYYTCEEENTEEEKSK